VAWRWRHQRQNHVARWCISSAAAAPEKRHHQAYRGAGVENSVAYRAAISRGDRTRGYYTYTIGGDVTL